MAKEILKHEPALWTFVYADGVEPTNNRAERALRNAVISGKISFGRDGERSSRFVECILTVTTTLKQQRRHVCSFPTAACEAALDGHGRHRCSPRRPDPPGPGASTDRRVTPAPWACGPHPDARAGDEKVP